MRNIFFLLAVAVIASCSTATTHVTTPINMALSPTVVLKIDSDPENLSGNISRRIMQLGFKPLPDGTPLPDYYAYVSYTTYWDVAYQTFSRFEIAFVDAKTKESRITSRYVGRVGFNSCNAALDIVFNDLASKMGIGTYTQSTAEVTPRSTYKQIGATLLSPGEAGWYLMQSTANGIAFGRQFGSKTETAIANTVVYKIEGFEDDKEFFDYIVSERVKNDDKTRFKILDTRNERMSFKNSSCLKYQWLSEDHKNKGIDSTDFQYLKTAGYICRHPFGKAIAFQMEISHRGKEKMFPEALLSVGEEFFNNIQFNDQGLK